MIGTCHNFHQKQANQLWEKHFYGPAQSAVPDDFPKSPQPDPTVLTGIIDQTADHLGVV